MESVIDMGRINQIKSFGGEDLIQQMCSLFIENAPKRVEDILQGWETKDFTRIEKGAHSLKSSSGNLGAMVLMELCQEIETLAERSNEGSLAALIPKINSLAEMTIKEIQDIGENHCE